MTHLITLAELDSGTSWRDRLRGCAASIGNFDGVHRGHRDLLKHVREAAERVEGPSVVVILDPHPAAVLRPHNSPPRLTTPQRRAELMSAMEIDYLLVCPATIEFLNRSADEFFQFLVRDRLQAQAMVEGPNFFFGRDRGGDVNRLRQLCIDADIDLTIAEPAMDGPRMISSSRIRESIANGQLSIAEAMLGSRYQIQGVVVAGEGRGRTLGFPTANLTQIDVMTPGHGVYAAIATTESKTTHRSAVHIGPNPTFDDSSSTKVEVHLMNYDGDLYGQSMTIDFIERVRPVQRFESADALVRQLNLDIQSVRDLVPISQIPQ